MSRVIVLDSAPLGLLCAPVRKGGEAADRARWLAGLLAAGAIGSGMGIAVTRLRRPTQRVA